MVQPTSSDIGSLSDLLTISVSVLGVETWLSFASLFVFTDLPTAELSIWAINQAGVFMLLETGSDQPVLVEFSFHVKFAICTWGIHVEVASLAADLCRLEISIVESVALVWAPCGAFSRTDTRCRPGTILARVVELFVVIHTIIQMLTAHTIFKLFLEEARVVALLLVSNHFLWRILIMTKWTALLRL